MKNKGKIRVGIITMIGQTNYGQRLQNFAVVELLKKISSVMPMTVNYVNASTSNKGYFTKLQRIKHILLSFVNLHYVRIRLLKFDNFNRELSFTSKVYPNINAKDFDYFVIGSDQVWNLEFGQIVKNIELFFGNFVPESKRVAFSASTGNPNIREEFVDVFVKGINGIPSISVREEQSVDIIRKLTGKDCICTLDPTLLLDVADWLRVSKRPKRIKKNTKFMLVYFLGEKSRDLDKYIKNISYHHNLKIVNVYDENQTDLLSTNFDKYCYTFSPSEFVWLVSNCEIMITDSFHGCAFSVIFKKPFKWFSRNQSDISNMDCRMTTLFSKLKLGDWCLGNNQQPLEQAFVCDYSKIDNILSKEKELAFNYLKGALNINEN